MERAKPYHERTPLDLREDFRERWTRWSKGIVQLHNKGETVQETEGSVEAYEVIFDPADESERYAYIHQFGLEAISAGFEIAAHITTPEVGFTPDGHKLHAITYFLKDLNQC